MLTVSKSTGTGQQNNVKKKEHHHKSSEKVPVKFRKTAADVLYLDGFSTNIRVIQFNNQLRNYLGE